MHQSAAATPQRDEIRRKSASIAAERWLIMAEESLDRQDLVSVGDVIKVSKAGSRQVR